MSHGACLVAYSSYVPYSSVEMNVINLSHTVIDGSAPSICPGLGNSFRDAKQLSWHC